MIKKIFTKFCNNPPTGYRHTVESIFPQCLLLENHFPQCLLLNCSFCSGYFFFSLSNIIYGIIQKIFTKFCNNPSIGNRHTVESIFPQCLLLKNHFPQCLLLNCSFCSGYFFFSLSNIIYSIIKKIFTKFCKNPSIGNRHTVESIFPQCLLLKNHFTQCLLLNCSFCSGYFFFSLSKIIYSMIRKILTKFCNNPSTGYRHTVESIFPQCLLLKNHFPQCLLLNCSFCSAYFFFSLSKLIDS